MKCPNCDHFIPPFKVLYISRWTFINCNYCKKQFGRKTNLQLFAIAVLLLLGFYIPFAHLMMLTEMHALAALIISWLICIVFWSPFVILADAATIQLVPIDEKKPEK